MHFSIKFIRPDLILGTNGIVFENCTSVTIRGVSTKCDDKLRNQSIALSYTRQKLGISDRHYKKAAKFHNGFRFLGRRSRPKLQEWVTFGYTNKTRLFKST